MSRPSQLGQSISQQGFFSSSRDSLTAPCVKRPSQHSHVSVTASEMDLSRNNQNKRKERGRLKGGEQPLLGSWNRTGGGRCSNANTIGTLPSTNHLNSGNNCNGTDRYRYNITNKQKKLFNNL